MYPTLILAIKCKKLLMIPRRIDRIIDAWKKRVGEQVQGLLFGIGGDPFRRKVTRHTSQCNATM